MSVGTKYDAGDARKAFGAENTEPKNADQNVKICETL